MNQLRQIGVAYLALLFATTSLAQPTPEYSAHYRASANGIAATAERTLTRLDSGAYRLSNTLKAEIAGQLIAQLKQSSEFELSGNRVIPQSYAYLLTGIVAASHAISYNWDAGIALSTEGDASWPIELSASVMDPLSHQFAMRQALDSGATANFEFKVIDGDAIELHVYRLIGDEVLTTPLGKLNCVKLERVREGSNRRSTTIWLARDWHYLLARIEQINAAGLRIELELESAVVDGTTVSALP